MGLNSLYSSSETTDVKLKSPRSIKSRLELQLVELLSKGPLTRDQMVKKLTVPRTTIYDGLKRLIVRNEVKKYPLYNQEKAKGRPKVLFSIIDEE